MICFEFLLLLVNSLSHYLFDLLSFRLLSLLLFCLNIYCRGRVTLRFLFLGIRVVFSGSSLFGLLALLFSLTFLMSSELLLVQYNWLCMIEQIY